MAIAFLDAFEYFTCWFVDYVAIHDIMNEEARERLVDSLVLLDSLEHFLIESSDSSEKAWREKHYIRHSEKHFRGSFGSKAIEDIILPNILELTELAKSLMKKVDNVEAQGERIEHKLDELQKQIKELTNQIGAYQSLVERQIEKGSFR